MFVRRALVQRERVLLHYQGAPARFLDAWKQAVAKIGHRFFIAKEGYDNPESVDQATDKWQLIPRWEYVEEHIGVLSTGEAVFLASVCSFYNGEWSQELFEKNGLNGYASIGDTANKLDLDRLEIITELMKNHTGW